MCISSQFEGSVVSSFRLGQLKKWLRCTARLSVTLKKTTLWTKKRFPCAMKKFVVLCKWAAFFRQGVFWLLLHSLVIILSWKLIVFFCSLPKLRSVTGGCYSPEVFAGKFTVQTSEVSSSRLNFLNWGMAGVVLERREKCMKLYLCAFWGFWVGGGGEGGRRRGLTVLWISIKTDTWELDVWLLPFSPSLQWVGLAWR